MLVLIAYAQKPSLIAHADACYRAISLMFGPILPTSILCVGSCGSAHLRDNTLSTKMSAMPIVVYKNVLK